MSCWQSDWQPLHGEGVETGSCRTCFPGRRTAHGERGNTHKASAWYSWVGERKSDPNIGITPAENKSCSSTHQLGCQGVDTQLGLYVMSFQLYRVQFDRGCSEISGRDNRLLPSGCFTHRQTCLILQSTCPSQEGRRAVRDCMHTCCFCYRRSNVWPVHNWMNRCFWLCTVPAFSAVRQGKGLSMSKAIPTLRPSLSKL